jgi:ATP-dependent Clp protease ATP-binding subunit ClpC
VFERFTDRARRVVVLAQEEARMLNHNYIGTEHVLLGMIHEGEGLAATALEALDISLDDVRADIQSIIGQGQSPPTGHIPFTPRAKKVLELSLREALQLGHNYIGTEHILLGLIREGDGVGAQVLVKRGATLDRVREEVLGLLAGYEGGAPQVPEPVLHDQPRCPKCRGWLSETAAYRVLEIPAAAEGDPRAVTFAFCRSCGTWLGTLA